MSDEVKWFKITTDIFDDEKIKYIESFPESDTLIVIWFKLLSLAARSNQSGYVMLTDKIPYTQEMLINFINRKSTVVKMALNTFEQLSMIEITDENAILISNWEKHQNVEGLDKIREQRRLRQQRFRDKQKALENKEDTDEEQEEDIDIEGNVKNNVTHNVIPYSEIINYLNEKTGKGHSPKAKETRKKIKARWNEGYGLDDFIKAIDNSYEHWSKSGDLSNMKPSTLFNGKFGERVTNDAYGWKKEEKSNPMDARQKRNAEATDYMFEDLD